ncbi:MAG: hypothetical protein IJ328_06425 [Muribaculaceae bacterium]|nr:hypothetical protein [Muribaculaceae bacterium]
MKNWIKGIPYEEAFWRSMYRNRKTRKGLFAWSKYGRELELPGFDAVRFLKESESDVTLPVVLDVGCGMSYCTGNKIDGKELNIRYVDPLAPYYNKILDDYKIDMPHIEFGMVEYLSSFFPKSDVSLIIVQNALDHSANPLKGIRECLGSLKVGGVLYLKHYINEAEYENYRGFHKFNVDEQDGKLIIWNRTETHDVGEIFKNYVTIRTKRLEYENRIHIVSVLTKVSELPIDVKSLKKDTVELCNNIIGISEEMNRTGSILKYHLSVGFYRIGHFFMKMLSYGTKIRLKNWINKLRK